MFPTTKFFLISYALAGLIISIVVAVMNRFANKSLSLVAQRRVGQIMSRKAKTVFCLFLAIIIGLTFIKFKSFILNRNRDVPNCYVRLRDSRDVLISIFSIFDNTKGHGTYPTSLQQLFRAMSASGIGRKDIEYAFICPLSARKEISFDYFNPENVKTGIDRYILLYEKPNNHFPKNRTVIYNTGNVAIIPEDDLYRLLSEQSRSPNSFSWVWSNLEEPMLDSWWLREKERRSTEGALFFTAAIAFPIGLGLYLGMTGLRRIKREGNN